MRSTRAAQPGVMKLPQLLRRARTGARCKSCVAIVLMCGALATAQESTVPLKGNLPPAVARAHQLGALDRREEIKFTITLPLRHRAQLEALLQGLYTLGHPLYHRYLNTGEFTERFGPTQADYDAVVTFVQQHGLRIRNTHAGRTLLDLVGSAELVEKAFGVHLLRFQTADGQVFRAPDAEPSLPASIAARVAGVIGLDDAVHRRPFDCIGSDPSYGLTPSDIKKAYNLDGLTLDGTGQTLGIASLSDYADSDITAYEDCFGLPHVPLQRIPINGGASSTVIECALDIEMAVAIAPHLDKILIYHTDSPNSLNMLATIALDNAAKLVSISWGAREDLLSDQERDSENNDFTWMAAQGQSVYVAAGDSGTGSLVNDPASQPYVVGVGGTSLFFDKDSGYLYELAWENGLVGGGGGVSTVWPLPTYQPTLVSPGSNGSATYRNVPDVSLNADPQTVYAIFYGGRWQKLTGGTSAAAPLWAAFTALVNQQRAINGAGPLGFPNPALYYLAHTSRYAIDFHDIIDSNVTGRYPVVPGYDNVTGLGSFNGANLLNDLRIDVSVLHVDGSFLGDFQDGTPANPFKTVTGAVNAAPANRATLIYIKANTYPENNRTFNKKVLLVNDGGGLVII